MYHADYMRVWRAKHPERAKEISQAGNRKYRRTKHKDYLAGKQKWYDNARAEIIKFFGGKCAHCGFTDPRTLQMDHIHRRAFDEKRLILNERIRLIRKQPEVARQRFQLLCANCNSIKRFENQEYANGRGKRGNGIEE